MKYIIHTAADANELEKRVNRSLDDGYELVGGVNITNTSVNASHLEYSQAMINKQEIP
jgi:membrane protease subunit (stomatin/prohibitin family)